MLKGFAGAKHFECLAEGLDHAMLGAGGISVAVVSQIDVGAFFDKQGNEARARATRAARAVYHGVPSARKRVEPKFISEHSKSRFITVEGELVNGVI